MATTSWQPRRSAELRHPVPIAPISSSRDSARPAPADHLVAKVPSGNSSPDGHYSETPKQPAHQRFVLTDPVAFRYLEEDPSAKVLERRRELQGFECYIVEQWACSRTDPTFVITTYTGDPAHSVKVGVLSVPVDEEQWSDRLKEFFKALDRYHARKRKTDLGMVMITNLSGFRSSLTVIPVPEGDVKKHREDFVVNENLKRLGCSGRAGLKLAKPSEAVQSKFYQLYKTSEKNLLYGSVIELVRLCQLALILFGKLEPVYADGLLCDATEKAINDWWIEIGTEYYNIEPHDGILGPTTVAALLGMVMGARNRLNAYGAPVAKDVFDVESTKRGITYFQKSQRLSKSKRLDRQTLERLHRVTAKVVSGEGWTMPKAVKSTVAELSGKGGEMVMDIVGGKDRTRIADIETVDIETFAHLVYGERAKRLWQGKPRKGSTMDMLSRLPGEEGLAFQKDDQGRYAWSGKRRESTTHDLNSKRRDDAPLSPRLSSDSPMTAEPGDRDTLLKRTVLKRATGRMNEARSGLGRIKDAVSLRNHQPSSPGEETFLSPGIECESATPSSTTSPKASTEAFGNINTITSDSRPDLEHDVSLSFTKTMSNTPLQSQRTLLSGKSLPSECDRQPELGAVLKDGAETVSTIPSVEPSIAGSTYHGIDLEDLLPGSRGPIPAPGPLLRRTQSLTRCLSSPREGRNDSWWPRHLSFSLAEDSVLLWDDISPSSPDDEPLDTDPNKELAKEVFAADRAKRLREGIAELGYQTNDWVMAQLTGVQDLDRMAERDQQELEELYYTRLNEYQTLSEEAQDILSQERQELQDAVKDVEILGAKLDYEINALKGKVEDVEDSVVEFERQVFLAEERVRELERQFKAKESWVHWVVRMITGFGKPPAES